MQGQGWAVRRDGERLVARFDGFLSAEAGQASAVAFAELLRDVPAGTAVVFDVSDMSGYASRARKSWQVELTPLRRRIGSIHMLGGNALVRMGGATLGMLLGIPVTHE